MKKGLLFRMLSAALLSTAALFATACLTTAQGDTKVVDPNADDALGGTGTESGDIKSLAERMAREIAGIKWPREGEIPRIAVLPITNETRFRVDPKLLQNKLTKELVNLSGGKVTYLARDTEEEVMAERQKKRAGMYDQGNEAAAMAGADYLLKGEMRALSKATREAVSDYIVYTFQMVDAETGGIIWVGDFETKKVGETGVVYQ
jgi:TolB-like protein